MENETALTSPVLESFGPGDSDFSKKTDLPALALLFVLPFVLHVTTAARTVTFSDSGDFLMGISTVGNIHGPGYPLYLMTGKLFSWLVPFGSLAFRMSLYSALFASLTTCLIYWILFRITGSRIGGVAAGLAYAFSYTFWYQTVIPETYSLNTFFIAVLVVLMIRWERMLTEGRGDSADNALCIFAFVFGLALTNHFSILFLLPAFAFFALDTSWRDVLAPRNLFRMAAFFTLGLLPYLYEPVAAFRGPAYNYGDPSTLTRWFRHITVYYQRGGLFGYPYRYMPLRFWRYFGTLTTEFPYFWWLGGVGLAASFIRRSKKYPLFFLFLFLLSLVPVMTYQQIESVLRAHFYYESYLIVSIWIGFGAAFLVRLVKRCFARADPILAYAAMVPVVLLVLVGPLASIALHYDKVDKHDYDYARDMAANMLAKVDRNSVIVCNEDNVLFPLMYIQMAERLRLDVRVVSSSAAGVPGFQGGDLLVYAPPDYAPKAGDDRYFQIIERNYGRLPVYTTVPTIVTYDWKQYPLGYLVRVLPLDAVLEPPPSKGPTSLTRSGGYEDSDARAAVLLDEALDASVLFGNNNINGAVNIYDDIIPTFQRDTYVPTLYSCGTFSELYELWGQALNMEGKYKNTVRILPNARVIDPDFYSTALAHAYASLGDYASAVDELSKYLAFQPQDASARADLGQAYLMLEDYPKAARELRESLRLSSSDARSHLLYGRVLFLQKRRDAAIREFETVIRLDGSGPFGSQAEESLEQLENR